MARFSRHVVLALCIGLMAGCGDQDASEGDGESVAQASVAKGGLLYDKFWKVSAATEPADTHPLWAKRPDAESNKRTNSDTWRCKECHGWDYKGVDGAYAKGSHRTGFAGVLKSKAAQAEIVTSLAETHGYRAAGLSDLELESLAMLVSQGLIDTAQWIDDTGAFRGDAARGKALYLNGLGKSKSCKKCHGADGLKPPNAKNKDYDDWVGKIANKNPPEFLHKIRFGHPGTKMPAAVRAGAPIQDIVDLCAFAQTLPKAK